MGIRRQITIVNAKGLHARPAASFVKLASQFHSKIRIRYDDKNIDGKSIMGVMMLAAEKGAKIDIEAEGPDQEDAVESLSQLVKHGFHENKDTA